MRLKVSSFQTHKHGNEPSECEDSHEPRASGACEGLFRAAVADGATEAMLSGMWAGCLTRAFVSCGLPPELDDFSERLEFGVSTETGSGLGAPRLLLEARRLFERERTAYLRGREERGRPVQWYEEPGLERGAYSTLLGFEMDTSAEGRWRVLAVGDSCLVHLRKDVLQRFPLDGAGQFDNAPPLLPSRGSAEERILSEFRVGGGDARAGDVFLLMTDALARWAYERVEAGYEPWGAFLGLKDEDVASFETLVDELRKEGMKNDDVTLMRILVEG